MLESKIEHWRQYNTTQKKPLYVDGLSCIKVVEESSEIIVIISRASIPTLETGVKQGDVFTDVAYSFIDTEDDECVEIFQYTFPYAVVMSQSCDVEFMNDFESGDINKSTKFMPAILMCPIYRCDQIKSGVHLKPVFKEIKRNIDDQSLFCTTEDLKVAKSGLHMRYHQLTVKTNDEAIIIDGAIVDFKHLFTVSMKYLRNIRMQRVCNIDNIYIDQIVNKMSAFLSRIGIPNN